MAALPTGTVTLLYSDNEDSTRLLQRLRERYPAVLEEQRALLRAAIADHDGHEVTAFGDGLFAVFSRAADGVAAAAACQRTLAAHHWPDGATIAVRIGVHTGEPMLLDGAYTGLDVRLAARICAAAHGGQTLLSHATRELVARELPDGISLRDLGTHRLADVTSPVRLFQLVADGLPDGFPPCSLDRRPNNVPLQRTPLIGREHELAEIKRLLLRDDVGLVTLTGTGGSGKSRLALAVAAELSDDFEDGVHFVSLASISDPGLVGAAIAQSLGLRESGDHPLLGILKRFLHDRHLLLVLDNFEQLLQAAPLVAELLTSGRWLKILVTSRALLRIYGEYDVPVPPLTLPGLPCPPPDQLSRYEAVRLFVDRARAVKVDFAVTTVNGPAVAEICSRLDGLPLAIELAAPRIRLLPAQALLARLERRLPMLVGGAKDLPDRHQTLRGTIAWSHDLLSADERALFRRLAVFVGGCTLTAVEAVIGRAWQLVGVGETEGSSSASITREPEDPDVLDGLELLIDKSLLRQEEQLDGQPRFVMLETIREYALEQLEASGEAELIRRCHAEHFLAVAEAAEAQFWDPHLSVWTERLKLEIDNVRAALEWCVAATEGPTRRTGPAPEPALLGLGLAGALCRFWDVLGRMSEGRERLTTLLALAPAPTAVRAKALNAAGFLAWTQGDFTAARHLLEEGLGLAHKHHLPEQVAFALVFLGCSLRQAGDVTRAIALLEESLPWWDQAGSKGGRSLALFWLADVLRTAGDHERARSCLEEGLRLSQELDDRFGTAFQVAALGRLASSQGDHARATPLLRQALILWRDLGDLRDVGVGLDGLALAAAAQGQARRAALLFGAATAVRERPGLTANPIWEDDHARAVEATRTGLGEAGFVAAWEEGRVLPLERAIETALASADAEDPAPPLDSEAARLSRREREVATLIARGYSTRAIAEELAIGTRTVEAHVMAIFNKLGVSSRAQIAVWAVDHGLRPLERTE